jgi:ABC-type multidrug transport system ATPase subunit
VLLLDDPTRGVDVGAKAELYRLIDRLVRQGIGVIMTSSELPELLTVSDRILVLSEGRLTASFSRGEATEHKIMEAATLGARKAGSSGSRPGGSGRTPGSGAPARRSWDSTAATSAAPAT